MAEKSLELSPAGIIAQKRGKRVRWLASLAAPPEQLVQEIANRLPAYLVQGAQSPAAFQARGTDAAALGETGHQVVAGAGHIVLLFAIAGFLVQGIPPGHGGLGKLSDKLGADSAADRQHGTVIPL